MRFGVTGASGHLGRLVAADLAANLPEPLARGLASEPRSV
jgi:uncharacterized protein YbjT (DUF2867 family)